MGKARTWTRRTANSLVALLADSLQHYATFPPATLAHATANFTASVGHEGSGRPQPLGIVILAQGRSGSTMLGETFRQNKVGAFLVVCSCVHVQRQPPCQGVLRRVNQAVSKTHRKTRNKALQCLVSPIRTILRTKSNRWLAPILKITVSDTTTHVIMQIISSYHRGFAAQSATAIERHKYHVSDLGST